MNAWEGVLASVVSPSEYPGCTTDELWRLIVEIQQASLRAVTHREDAFEWLGERLAVHPLIARYGLLEAQAEEQASSGGRAGAFRSEGLAGDELPSTVVLHPSSDAPDKVLRRLLMHLEGEGSELGVWLRKHDNLILLLKEAIYTCLASTVQRKAERAHQQREREREMYNFAYGLSHEINNPLANIAARAEQLVHSVPAEHRRSLQTIADQAMRAHEILAEMMLAVQLPPIHPARLDLRRSLLEAAATWSKWVEERQMEWNEAIDDQFLWGDFDITALREAISAGIRNALDACRSGHRILFVAERCEGPEGEPEIRIAIIDNGPGLSAQALEQAWDLYYCGREAGRGLGIGLAKIRRIIGAHHGRVWIDSKVQQGCGLEMRLPWKRSS